MMTCRSEFKSLVWMIVTLLVCLLPLSSGKCRKGVKELWAYPSSSNEDFEDFFRKYVTSSKGSVCRWLVQASGKDASVHLDLDPFQLKTAKGSKEADCLEIYDGGGPASPMLDEICDNNPALGGYSSNQGGKLFVVYRRGEVDGDRSIGFNYKAVEPSKEADFIRIAVIVGGTVAGIGVIFLTIRYTKCFSSCFRNKDNNGDTTTRHHGGGDHDMISNNLQERDRLTTTTNPGVILVVDGDDEIAETSITNNNSNNNNYNNNSNNNSTIASANGAASNERMGRRGRGNSNSTTDDNNSNVRIYANLDNNSNQNNHLSVNNNSNSNNRNTRRSSNIIITDEDLNSSSDSGSDVSLPVQNEPPPSYESLYLNEQGEQPPEYSPPEYRSKNPPRRVHTFN